MHANRVGRMTTAGHVKTYVVSSANVCPYGIALGVDKKLWFAESCGNAIGRIDRYGNVREYRLPPHQGTPEWTAQGADGAMWFTCFNGATSTVGRIDLHDH